MKKRLYLVRHGQTMFNRQHRIQGWCDSPLTETGKSQALAVKDWFTEKGIRFDAAYSSTSERCCDTLELITDQPYLTGIMEKDGCQSVLAVSHGGACFNFIRGIGTDMGWSKNGITNCCIFVLEYTKEKFVMTDYIPNPVK